MQVEEIFIWGKNERKTLRKKGFNFNLTYGLKPQVSGIKIATIYRRSIFQVEWLIDNLVLSTELIINN